MSSLWSGALASLLGAVAGSFTAYWLTTFDTRQSELIKVKKELSQALNETANGCENLYGIYRIIEICLAKHPINKCWSREYNAEITASESAWDNLNLEVDYAKKFFKKDQDKEVIEKIITARTLHSKEMARLVRPAKSPETARAMSSVFNETGTSLKTLARTLYLD